MFASNVHRLRMLGDIARRHGRKIVAARAQRATHARVARHGRSTGEHAGARTSSGRATSCGPPSARASSRSARVLGVATGTQGEARAALARLARGEHPAFDLGRGRRRSSSRAASIPGNEPDVVRVMGDLLRRGVELRTLVVGSRAST